MLRETSTSLAVYPGDESIVFLGTRKGIFVTLNQFAAPPTWAPWNKGMTVNADNITVPLQVSSLKFVDRRFIDGTTWLIASTYGRSMWERGVW